MSVPGRVKGESLSAERDGGSISALLSVRDIARAFGGVQALDGVSFDIAAGEFTALIGPNGAGKSTLFNVIAGALAPDRGELRFSDEPLAGPPSQRVRLGLGRTFQTAAAFGSMTLRENVLTAIAARDGRAADVSRSLWRLPTEEADVLLDRVGLGVSVVRAAADLAYPELKRLELAIALASRPRLLLMDEPTAGMAPAERHALMAHVQSVAAGQALTVLFTEHSMDVVFAHARRVLVMANGRLIADGAPDAVRADAAAQAAYFGSGA